MPKTLIPGCPIRSNGRSQQAIDSRKRHTRTMLRLLEENYSMEAISIKMGIPLVTLQKWRRKADEKLEKRYSINLVAERYRKDLQLCYIFREAAEQWEASKKDAKGNPRLGQVVFLDRMLAVIESQRKMYGLDVVNKDGGDTSSHVFDWKSLTSVNVTVNNHAPNTIEKLDKAMRQVEEIGLTRVVSSQELNNDVDDRIEELERRARLREEQLEMERQLEDNRARNVKRLVLKQNNGRVIHTNAIDSNVSFSQENHAKESVLESMLGIE